ncbi:PilZ domain-containing protein [Rummeliibacillus stabekisii]|uniref:PilZ domain-containing protein n=1 Tax=Rummeliibacillus stabekisii TaxID=241244 RepID=UPI00116CF895|nr:PilZ domain-containing protein [Rummeliibacillus stabekisii]MBB5170149.1 hypothetical protein [Rummeliibacillus stabekisii]GEL04408.1 hypothetical protein RST01_10350 [Rummeliibacillus stabekisii]
MKFKRTESFRHIFENRITSKYKVIMDGIVQDFSSTSEFCQLVDLSPSGARIALNDNLPIEGKVCVIELLFVLHTKPIAVHGEVKWKRPAFGHYYYGIDLETDELIETLIISELKLRRKQEIIDKKQHV